MKTVSSLLLVLSLCASFPVRAETYLVKNGIAKAEIVISENSTRMQRVGIRNDPAYHQAHGMAGMTNHEAVYTKHLERLALYGGKLNYKPESSTSQLGYSASGLVEGTARNARALLDSYDLESVSPMPPDNIEKLDPNILVLLVGGGRGPVSKAGVKCGGQVPRGWGWEIGDGE
ncbi:MAG: hypothetical protein P1U58_01245 [Verrucomicrobiales bacterium]|nr:hypothetical protein [Verrucomicrobiales bacterium]